MLESRRKVLVPRRKGQVLGLRRRVLLPHNLREQETHMKGLVHRRKEQVLGLRRKVLGHCTKVQQHRSWKVQEPRRKVLQIHN